MRIRRCDRNFEIWVLWSPEVRKKAKRIQYSGNFTLNYNWDRLLEKLWAASIALNILFMYFVVEISLVLLKRFNEFCLLTAKMNLEDYRKHGKCCIFRWLKLLYNNRDITKIWKKLTILKNHIKKLTIYFA